MTALEGFCATCPSVQMKSSLVSWAKGKVSTACSAEAGNQLGAKVRRVAMDVHPRNRSYHPRSRRRCTKILRGAPYQHLYCTQAFPAMLGWAMWRSTMTGITAHSPLCPASRYCSKPGLILSCNSSGRSSSLILLSTSSHPSLPQ